MIDFSLDKQQLQLREEIVAFARKHLNDDVDGRDERGEFCRDLWEKCGDLRLQGLGVSQDYGGRGLNAVDMVIALEALGYGSRDSGLNFALAAHLLACVMPIAEFGDDRQKKTWLPGLCDGRDIATNAMTEVTPGSDVYAMATTAQLLSEDTYKLSGVKTYCSNGPVCNRVVTYAMTDEEKGAFGGISCFVLFEGIHGFDKTPAEYKLGVRTTQMGMIVMENTEVDAAYRLGQSGAGTVIFNRSMEWERICLGAIHLGDMDRLLEDAVKFAKGRTMIDGRSIASFQSVSHVLAELKTRLESARLLTYQAAWRLKEGKSVIREAAMAKNAVGTLYKDFCLRVGQIYGGGVFRGRHDLERSLRHSIGATVYSGTTEVQNAIIARTLGLK